MTAWLILVPVFIFVVVVFILLATLFGVLRRSARRVPAPRYPMPVATRSGPDGFWVENCPANVGDLLYYHYWADGIRHAGHVNFYPDSRGGQYVYTGHAPAQVTIHRIVGVGEVSEIDLLPPLIEVEAGMPPVLPPDYADGAPPANWSGGHHPGFSSGPPGGGFPAAY